MKAVKNSTEIEGMRNAHVSITPNHTAITKHNNCDSRYNNNTVNNILIITFLCKYNVR